MRDRRIGSLVRDPRLWIVALSLVAVFVAQAVVGSGVSARGALTSVVCAVALAGCVVVAVDRGHHLVSGAALVMVPPSALYDVANGGASGTLAVLVGVAVLGAPARWPKPGASGPTAVAVTTAGLIGVAWWFVSSDEQVGLTPTWTRILDDTGDTLRRAIGGVGVAADGAAMTVEVSRMAWAVAVGLVVGAAVVAGRRRAAMASASAVGAFVAVAWGIERWRGPVDPVAGLWVLTAGVAVAAAGSDVGRVLDRRLGRAAISLASSAWLLSLVQQVRRTGGGDIELVVAMAPVAAFVVIWIVSAGPRRPAGVNVIGYFDVTSGLGERARTLADLLRAGGVDVSEWNVANTPSPQRHDVSSVSTSGHDPIRYDTTIAVVTALEFGGLEHTHHDLVRGVDRLIGYWFWELDTVPDTHDHALAMVDEVWTPSRFVRDAYRSATTRPVRLVGLPIPEPVIGDPDGDPFDRGGDSVFLVSFDHLSAVARKNPFGAIEAFGRAFPNGDEPVRLVVKTINGDRVPEADAAVRRAAADPRIEVRDEHLTEPDQLALVAAADAFVSLHRSEGLGLQPAAAMWLGTPVIASAYAGTLDLMDARTALLVPVTRIPVVDGGGAYPDGAWWADPDLDAAAAAMRRVVDDPSGVAAIAAAAREHMAAQCTAVEVGRLLQRVLTGWASSVEPWSPTDRGDIDSVAAMETRFAHHTDGAA